MNPQPKPKTVRLKGKARKELRERVFEKYEGCCVSCGRYVPLYNQYGYFDLWGCGHMAHKKSIGAGGSDTLENCEWKCSQCHLILEHTKGMK